MCLLNIYYLPPPPSYCFFGLLSGFFFFFSTYCFTAEVYLTVRKHRLFAEDFKSFRKKCLEKSLLSPGEKKGLTLNPYISI